jgi:hypothetical protein
LLQLWAVQLAQYATEGLVYHVENAQRDIWLGLCSKLEREASGIVALEQFCTVENTSSKVGNISTSESVGLAKVTADVEELGLYADVSSRFKWSEVKKLSRHVIYVRGELQHSKDPL